MLQAKGGVRGSKAISQTLPSWSSQSGKRRRNGTRQNVHVILNKCSGYYRSRTQREIRVRKRWREIIRSLSFEVVGSGR